MVIKPDAIPQFGGDLGAVETHAAALKSAGATFRTTGQNVHSTWQGLSAFYEAPEASRLFGATVPVKTGSDAVAGDIEEVGAALAAYAAAVRPIANRLTQLRGEASTFRAGIDGDDDWREDGDQVNRNNELVSQVDTQVAALMAAERETANRINRLYGGTQWTVSDGSEKPNAYGFDAGQLPGDADRPWGSSEEKDEPWYVDTWNWVWNENKGFFVDGLWGDLKGLWGLVNVFDWDTFSSSWGGLWMLTGGLVFDTENSLKAWKEFGKSFLAWDEWSKDPARAFGNVLYNVVTLPLAPAKAGTVGKAGKGAAAAADAGKAADAAKAAEAAAGVGRLADDLGTVADVGKVDTLPTVGDLARQIDAALGDALKADPSLELALRQADEIAAAERATPGDHAPPRVREPALVGAGHGGVDVTPSTGRGGGGDLPPSTGHGGGGHPPSAGHGGGAVGDVGSAAGHGAGDAGRGAGDAGSAAGDAGSAAGHGAGDAGSAAGHGGGDAGSTAGHGADAGRGGADPGPADDAGRGADDGTDPGRGPEEPGGGGRGDDTGGSGGGGQDAGRAADDAAEQPRYGDDDLEPTGLRDERYGQELKIGPDGNLHFPGDRADTWRDENGGLHDAETNRFTTDDNKPLGQNLDVRAEPDVSTVARHTPDETGPGTVRDAVADRTRIVEQRTQLWDGTLQPIAEKLRAHDITVNEATLSPKKIENLLDDAEGILTRSEMKDLRDAGRRYNELAVDLRAASERLGTAGGDFVVGRDFPGARTVTEGEGLRGTPNNLDRILYDDSGSGRIIVIEEKGAGSGLGSRLVDDPANPTGARIRAEQMSTEYLRHMLEHDNKLADVLRKDPELRAAFQRILDGTDPGQLQYRLVQTSDRGVVTVTDYVIDADRLGRGAVTAAGSD